MILSEAIFGSSPKLGRGMPVTSRAEPLVSAVAARGRRRSEYRKGSRPRQPSPPREGQGWGYKQTIIIIPYLITISKNQ